MIRSTLLYTLIIAAMAAGCASIAFEQIEENQNTRQSQIDYYTK